MSEFLEIYRPEPSDEERIDQEISRAQEAGERINDAAARAIACQLHSGQWSAFYSFGSSGHVNAEALTDEIAANRREFAENLQVLGWLDALDAHLFERRGES